MLIEIVAFFRRLYLLVAGLSLGTWVMIAIVCGIIIFSYLYWDAAVVGGFVKRFFAKTLPAFWKKFVIKKLPTLLAKALAKTWVKKLLLTIAVIIAGVEGRRRLEAFQENMQEKLHDTLVKRPRLWWTKRGAYAKAFIIIGLIGLILLIVGLEHWGIAFLAIDLLFEGVVVVFLALGRLIVFLLPRVGATQIVVQFQRRIIPWLWGHMPRRIRESNFVQRARHRWTLFAKWYIGRIAIKYGLHARKKVTKIIKK